MENCAMNSFLLAWKNYWKCLENNRHHFIGLLSPDIYDNMSCDGYFNLGGARNMGITNHFPPIGQFTLDNLMPSNAQPQVPTPQSHPHSTAVNHQQSTLSHGHHQQHQPHHQHHQQQAQQGQQQSPPQQLQAHQPQQHHQHQQQQHIQQHHHHNAASHMTSAQSQQPNHHVGRQLSAIHGSHQSVTVQQQHSHQQQGHVIVGGQQQQQQQQHQTNQMHQNNPPIGYFDASELDRIQNPNTIGVFQSNSVLSNGIGVGPNNNTSTSTNMYGGQSHSSNTAITNDSNQTTRETGIIEKLLVSNMHILV